MIYIIIVCWLKCMGGVVDSSSYHYSKEDFCKAWSAATAPPVSRYAGEIVAYELNVSSGTIRRVECSITEPRFFLTNPTEEMR